jgi:O-acetyl-ADP-ribose deacetylase (regulator of RNase III)
MIRQTKFVRFGDLVNNVEEGIIIHGCNAQGVMGSGIALQIRNKYPDCYLGYKNTLVEFKKSGIDPMGLVIPYHNGRNLIICNGITQDGFGRADGKRYVNYEAVLKVFEQSAQMAITNNAAIHYPQIGAGLGQGDWSVISDIIETVFQPYPEIERTLWIYQA